MKTLFLAPIQKVMSKKVQKALTASAELQEYLFQLEDYLEMDITDEEEKDIKRLARDAEKVVKNVSKWAKKLAELNL